MNAFVTDIDNDIWKILSGCLLKPYHPLVTDLDPQEKPEMYEEILRHRERMESVIEVVTIILAFPALHHVLHYLHQPFLSLFSSFSLTPMFRLLRRRSARGARTARPAGPRSAIPPGACFHVDEFDFFLAAL